MSSRSKPPGRGLPKGRTPGEDARDRILRTAHDLFAGHGLCPVGVDRITAEANVAKMTLYRHFRSKEDLARAVIEYRDEHWTRGWLAGEMERRSDTPPGRMLAVFDALDDWFHSDGYEGCLFTNTLLESRDCTSALGAACTEALANVRGLVERQANEAGIDDPDGFARQWQMLMSGAFIAAFHGDREAARRGRAIGALMLEREGVPTV